MFSRLLPSGQRLCENNVACSTPFLSLMHLQSYQSIDKFKKNSILGSTKGKYIFVEWNQHFEGLDQRQHQRNVLFLQG